MFNQIWNKSLSLLASAVLVATISGCATYGKSTELAGMHIANKDYVNARLVIEDALTPDGKDRLLYHLELGLIDHLSGKYQASNASLDLAEKIAEDLQTASVADGIKVIMSSPRQGAYRGALYERALLHYYKALNYSFLAHENIEMRASHLEGARIEARKVDIMLTALQNEKGNYKDIEDKKKGLFSKLMKIFRELHGRTLDEDWLVYREDAYIRYMAGLTYESNREYDDARVSYQQAAELYEKGYAKQYKLGQEITELAWFDTIRMMKAAGGYEGDWPDLVEKKLTPDTRQYLESLDGSFAQLVVITHSGMVPQRQEMNIHLTLNVHQKRLVLRPILTGTPQQRNDQASWFYAMYADRGLWHLIDNYTNRGLYDSLDGLKTQKIDITAVWPLAEAIKLPQALAGLGARVTVPFYYPRADDFGQTELWIDGHKQGVMIAAESLAQLGLQEQLLNADTDLKQALGRELVKSMTCDLLGEKILVTICKLAGAGLSQAETRNWLTLPDTISVRRVFISPGVHKIKLLTHRKPFGGLYHEAEYEVDVKKGEILILRERVLPRSGPQGHNTPTVAALNHE